MTLISNHPVNQIHVKIKVNKGEPEMVVDYVCAAAWGSAARTEGD